MRVLGFFLPIPFYGLPCRSWGPDCLTLSLSVDDAASCDGPISPNEAHAALLGMPKSKSPGSDGLPMEFYVAFLDLLGWDLVNVFNSSLEAGLLPFSQHEALIALNFQER